MALSESERLQILHAAGRHGSPSPDDRKFWVKAGCPRCVALFNEIGMPRAQEASHG